MHYDVTVDMGPGYRWTRTFVATTPAQARAACWRDLCEPFPMSFRDFLKVCKAVRRCPHPSSDGYAAVERQYGKRLRVGQRVRLTKFEGDFEGQEGTLVYPGESTCYAHVLLDGWKHHVVIHPFGVEVIEPKEKPQQ